MQPELKTCPLSESELRVVRLLAEGKSSKEAAIALGISPNTVNNYIVMAKVKSGNPGNSVGLVAKAIREGLI